MKMIAFFTILTGLLLTIFIAFTLSTKEKVVDICKVEINRNKPHNVKWSSLIGVVIMEISGVILWKSYKE